MKPLRRIRVLLLAPFLLTAGLLGAPQGHAAPSTRPAVAQLLHNPAPFVLPRKVALGSRAAQLARRWVGVPYRWGGSTPQTGFDCSGLVSYVYGRLGIELPHNAAAQFSYGRPVKPRDLRPGDLLFYRGLGHVGLYLGQGRWIHSPQSGESVRIDLLTRRSDLYGARRLVS